MTEGILLCSHPQCLSEFPIIDGIPIIVSDLRNYISQNILPLLERHDLTATMESLLGDCFGPGSAFDSQRQHLSTYAFDHYADLDPEETATPPSIPGSVARLLKQGLQSLTGKKSGPIIDIGCAVGRSSFELAQEFDDLVLGVDINFSMLKVAASIMETGQITYPKRRVGITYDRREFSLPADKKRTDKLDFWVCDATALPLASESFSLAVSLNLLDCVTSPYDHLKELARVLSSKSCGIIATPYDWSANATPVGSWLGGHSQRSPYQGASEAILRSLLAGGDHPNALAELALISEQEIPWSLRLHDRSHMQYQVQMTMVQKYVST